MKRVLFIINKMNFRPSSGHGICMKGIVKAVLDSGNFIDIVCDGEPEENFLSEYGINVYVPSSRMSYFKHSTLFQFSDSFNFEKAINFREAITTALSNHVYDLIICNDTESAFVCYQMELYKHIKVASYAHECATLNPELQFGVFRKSYYNLINKMMSWPEIITLVQTEQNKEKLIDMECNDGLNIRVLPYALTDSDDLGIKEKEGILFIGRHEDRKNPGDFIKALKKIKEKYGVEIKAKVMTRTAHIKKFEKDFQDIGYSNFEIVADIVGEQKAKFIQGSKIAFLPYKNESFGIAVLECLRYMPVVLLSKYDWHFNFKGFSNYISAETADLTDTIWNAYNSTSVKDVTKEFEAYTNEFDSALQMLLHLSSTATEMPPMPRNRLFTYLQQNCGSWKSLKTFFKEENDKGVIYLASDIETLYTNRLHCQVAHTAADTYFGIPDENGKLDFESQNDSDFFTF